MLRSKARSRGLLHDRYVPVLAWRVGVPVLRRLEPVSQLGVELTLAALLQSPSPQNATEPPLF